MDTTKREEFKSRFGVLMAMVGSAVGLGNLWRFPYLMGTNGGAVFILVYLIFVCILCLPTLYSEFIIGRRGQSNAFGAFKTLAPGSKFWLFGLLAALVCVMIDGFYCVVGGWTLNYLGRSLTFHLLSEDPAQMQSVFEMVSSSVWGPLVCFYIFMAFNIFIVASGVEKGIEKYSKFMTPALFILIVVMAIYSATFQGAGAGYRFMFKVDFSGVTIRTLNDAMGQAFMSLSIGCGTILTYASYVSKDHHIMATGTQTAVFDTLFALLAGCAIMPAVFAFGISPSEGPGLVFVTLPSIFAKIPGGSVMAVIFFFVLFIAALTSSISIMEVLTSLFMDQFRTSRKKALTIASACIVALGTLCSLSLCPGSQLRLMDGSVFDFCNNASAFLMPVGGLIVVIFVGWKLRRPVIEEELTNRGTLKIKHWLLTAVYVMIKYVTPLILLTIIVISIIQMI